MDPPNCIILGSGRSGTSLVAGMLGSAGRFFMGTSMLEATDANPGGFFEDREVNSINEELLAHVDGTGRAVLRLRSLPGYTFLWRVTPARGRRRARSLLEGGVGASSPRQGQRWLSTIPVGQEVKCSSRLRARMERLTRQRPFCFKDPRFCYTLSAWRPSLSDCVFICVFREPERTAHSIVKECRTAPYLRGVSVAYAQALDVWSLMYRHVLEIHQPDGRWIFVHYQQLLDGSAADRIEGALGVDVDRAIADPGLSRSSSSGSRPPHADEIYRRLCSLAGLDAGRSLTSRSGESLVASDE